jgi:pimeloyl-ACP methyl ester carboxylesterase
MPDIEVGGRRVRFSNAGAGEPVVLLHAASGTSAQWRALTGALLARGGLRVLAVDLQGYGGSAPWDPRQEMRLEDEFAPLRAVLDHAGGGPAHLVGHSYGGMLALRFALADPAPPLLSLALAEPAAFWLLREAGEESPFAEIRAVAEAFSAAFDAGDAAGAAAPYVDYWAGPGAWAGLPDAVRAYIVATAGKARRQWAVGLGDAEPGAPLGAIGQRLRSVPTLLLRGRRTRAPTHRVVDLLRGALPGAELAEVPGAGHMAPLTHPGPVNAAIEAHLARTAR